MKIIISKTRATLTEPGELTSGMVGKTISLEFSDEWQGLNIIAVFSNGSISKDVVNPQAEVIIPWEVLAKPNKPISVGFYGYNIVDGVKVLAIPTIYVDIGKTQAGADPSGDTSAEVTPTVAEQIQADVNSNTERIEALEQGGGGSGAVRSVNGKTGAVVLNAEDVGALPDDTYIPPEYDDTELREKIDDIEAVIPSAASESNQLADKDFVNSSVGTNTANYISKNGQPFNSLAELEAYSGTVTNNDYAFVVGTDSQGNTTYTRYKYNESTEAWAAEFVLNNSSFTAAQWAAIQSGITSGDVALIRTALQPSDLTPYAKTADVETALTDVKELIAQKITSVPIQLIAANWHDKSQMVEVPGILADETAQLIQPVPASASMAAYYDAGVLATGQAANSLTFSCEEVPTADITVYVVITEVSANAQ